MSSIADRLAEVQGKVDEATRRSGRGEGAANLLVVSKTWPTDTVREVVDAGQLLFGENKLQEGEVKVPALPDNLEWHFIGTLQRNKVRKTLPLFHVVHSISSMKLARFTDRVAGELELKPKIFLELNLAGEDSKHGFTIEELRSALDEICAFQNVDFQGLMCIPPKVDSPEEARPWFTQLREFQEDLRMRSGLALPEISMGMSGDYEVAIEEGSTIVRVGSAIFGPRQYPPV